MENKIKIPCLAIIYLLIICTLSGYAQLPDTLKKGFTPVKVSILGTYHMANPGQDAANIEADDVKSKKRQKELARLADMLAKFNPDKVAIEGSYGNQYYQKRYSKFLNHGNFDSLNHNERQQIGFRLAAKLGHKKIYPIDHPQKLDEDSIATLMKNDADINSLAKQMMASWNREAARETKMLREMTIPEFLREINANEEVQNDHKTYLEILHFGKDRNYGGADMVASWYKRNFYIYHNLTRITDFKNDDRILLIYGSGHLKILQDLITESPFYEYVPVTNYLK